MTDSEKRYGHGGAIINSGNDNSREKIWERQNTQPLKIMDLGFAEAQKINQAFQASLSSEDLSDEAFMALFEIDVYTAGLDSINDLYDSFALNLSAITGDSKAAESLLKEIQNDLLTLGIFSNQEKQQIDHVNNDKSTIQNLLLIPLKQPFESEEGEYGLEGIDIRQGCLLGTYLAMKGVPSERINAVMKESVFGTFINGNIDVVRKHFEQEVLDTLNVEKISALPSTGNTLAGDEVRPLGPEKE